MTLRLSAALARFALLALLALCLTACGTPETANVPDGTREFSGEMKSGDAGSEAATTEVATQISGAYMGDAVQSSVDARATRQTNATTSGHILKGFDFGGAATLESLKEAVENDPMVAALQAALDREGAKASPNPALEESLRSQLMEYLGSMRESAVKMGGDLGQLQSLVVVNVMHQQTGTDADPMNEHEAEASKRIPETVEKALDGAARSR